MAKVGDKTHQGKRHSNELPYEHKVSIVRYDIQWQL